MNGAPYQRSGRDPLRSNPQSEHAASVKPDMDSGKACKGTAQLRTYTATVAAAKIKADFKGQNNTPDRVSKFDGRSV